MAFMTEIEANERIKNAPLNKILETHKNGTTLQRRPVVVTNVEKDAENKQELKALRTLLRSESGAGFHG